MLFGFQRQPAHEATWEPWQQSGQFVPSETIDALIDGRRSHGRWIGKETRASPPSREKTPPRWPSFSRLPPGGFLFSSIAFSFSFLFIYLPIIILLFFFFSFFSPPTCRHLFLVEWRMSDWLNDYFAFNWFIFNCPFLALSSVSRFLEEVNPEYDNVLTYSHHLDLTCSYSVAFKEKEW